MSTRVANPFNNPEVVDAFSSLHDKYVVVPADKSSNNIVFICKNHYLQCLTTELGINRTTGNHTYSLTSFTKDEILQNHNSVLLSVGINIKENEENLPSLYWIPKLHKTPYTERYIAGSSKCSTKHLSKVLTTILSTVKDGLQKYCDEIYSTSGVNQMWILKNSKDLLPNLRSKSLQFCSNIKTFDLPTLYTTIPYAQLKDRLHHLIKQSFFYKNGNRRYKFLVLGYNNSYFVKTTLNLPENILMMILSKCWTF